MKPGVKTTEHAAVWGAIIASIVLAVVPILQGIVPRDSAWVPILAGLLAIAGVVIKYTGGRTALKLQEGQAVKELGLASDPSHPSPPTSPESPPQ